MPPTYTDDMNFALRTETSGPAHMSPQRVGLEVLWLRAGKNPERFREAIIEASEGELPLALMICESPDEVSEEALAGVFLDVPFPTLSKDEEDLFSRSGDWLDRLHVAGRLTTSPEIWARLAGDEDHLVRSEIARNRFAPAGVLVQLTEYPSIAVRASVAENLSAPAEALARLAGDETVGVRGDVVRNPSTPICLLRVLAEDRDPWVRQVVAASGRLR